MATDRISGGPNDHTHEVTHEEARAIAKRFIDGHFKNDGEHPRMTIPADEGRDDDLRLLAYINRNKERELEREYLFCRNDARELLRYCVTLRDGAGLFGSGVPGWLRRVIAKLSQYVEGHDVVSIALMEGKREQSGERTWQFAPDGDAVRSLIFDGGKYEVVMSMPTPSAPDMPVMFRAFRNGEPWRDLIGDKLVASMFEVIDDLTRKQTEYEAVGRNIHAWRVLVEERDAALRLAASRLELSTDEANALWAHLQALVSMNVGGRLSGWVTRVASRLAVLRATVG